MHRNAPIRLTHCTLIANEIDWRLSKRHELKLGLERSAVDFVVDFISFEKATLGHENEGGDHEAEPEPPVSM